MQNDPVGWMVLFISSGTLISVLIFAYNHGKLVNRVEQVEGDSEETRKDVKDLRRDVDRWHQRRQT